MDMQTLSEQQFREIRDPTREHGGWMYPPEPTRKHERGATLVLMAVVTFLALGLAAVAIDYGMVKTAKAEAQRAMDASALAGASAFQTTGSNAVKDALARSRAT